MQYVRRRNTQRPADIQISDSKSCRGTALHGFQDYCIGFRSNSVGYSEAATAFKVKKTRTAPPQLKAQQHESSGQDLSRMLQDSKMSLAYHLA